MLSLDAIILIIIDIFSTSLAVSLGISWYVEKDKESRLKNAVPTIISVCSASEPGTTPTLSLEINDETKVSQQGKSPETDP